MPHIRYDDPTDRPDDIPDAWLPVSAALNVYAIKEAPGQSVSSISAPGCAYGSPACWVPSKRELRVDSDICLPGTSPGTVDMKDVLWRLQNPQFVGAADHEIGHIKHTRWQLPDLHRLGADARAVDVVATLEEPRCEARLLSHSPSKKLFLRAASMSLIIEDFVLPDTRYGAAASAALLLARADGGTLLKKDVAPFVPAITGILGEKDLEALRLLWQEYLALSNYSFTEMLDVARRWLEVVGDGPSPLAAAAMFMPEDSEGGEEPGSLQKQVGQQAATAAVRIDSAVVQKRGDERQRRADEAARADAARRKDGQSAHSRAFPGGVGASAAPGLPHLTGQREPTADERRAAVVLAAELEQAVRRESAVEKVRTARPPGRLDGRAAAQSAAYQALGRRDRAEMFRGRRLAATDEPPLTVGLLLDISGSMKDAAAPLASAQWVLSTAVSDIDARIASVHFGMMAHGAARGGSRSDAVQVFECLQPWENFQAAFLAIDRELSLLDGTGARLLVIASDGYLRKKDQREYAEAAMALCKQKGAAVIWTVHTARGNESTYGFGRVVDVQGMEPARVALLIGRAAVAELRNH